MPSAQQMDAAAERRATMYDLIATSIRDRGYPPTQSELAADTGVSKPQVRIDLRILEQLGYIERDEGVQRGIRLVPEAERTARAEAAQDRDTATV